MKPAEGNKFSTEGETEVLKTHECRKLLKAQGCRGKPDIETT